MAMVCIIVIHSNLTLKLVDLNEKTFQLENKERKTLSGQNVHDEQCKRIFKRTHAKLLFKQKYS